MASDNPTSVVPKPVLTTMGGIRGWDVGGVRSFAYINCLDREYEDTKANWQRSSASFSTTVATARSSTQSTSNIA